MGKYWDKPPADEIGTNARLGRPAQMIRGTGTSEKHKPITRPRWRDFSTAADWLSFRRFRFLEKLVRKGIIRHPRPVRLAHPEAPGRFYLRPGTSDFGIFWEIFIDRFYDPLLNCHPENSVPSVQTVIDLGGNCGLFTLFALSYFPEARILTVEPDAGNMDVCRLNTGHAASHRVILKQACAAATSGEVSLCRSGLPACYTMIAPCCSSDRIRAMTVPELLDDAGIHGKIDILKCDIEGAEKELFADCRDWIGRVQCISIELHAPYTVQHFQQDLARNAAGFDIIHHRDCGHGSVMLTLRRHQ